MPAPPTIPYDPSAGSSYPSVDFRDIAYVEIFPAIGIARVGNSGSTNGKRSGPVDYFLGPELPQTVYNPVGGYRDGNQAIKRQVNVFLRRLRCFVVLTVYSGSSIPRVRLQSGW